MNITRWIAWRLVMCLAVSVVLVTTVRAQGPIHDHTEYPLHLNTLVELGGAVRVDGEWAIALARIESSVSGAMGALFVYRRTTAGWALHSVLRPDPRDTTIFGEGGGFGSFESIAIRQGRIAVG